MDATDSLPLEPATGDEALSRTELQIEQEKLKLERERILLERERLESARQRVQAQEGLHTDQNGRLAVKLSTLILVSIICTLVGGILGAPARGDADSGRLLAHRLRGNHQYCGNRRLGDASLAESHEAQGCALWHFAGCDSLRTGRGDVLFQSL